MTLFNRSVYLAGPIDNCTHEEMWDWRIQATGLLLPMFCFNPCRRTFDMAGGNTDTISKQVVTLDKAEIAASDCVLAWYKLPAAGTQIVGTLMEIIHAFERGKLVVVVSEETYVSSWIDYHAHARFQTLGPACQYIKKFYE